MKKSETASTTSIAFYCSTSLESQAAKMKAYELINYKIKVNAISLMRFLSGRLIYFYQLKPTFFIFKILI